MRKAQTSALIILVLICAIPLFAPGNAGAQESRPVDISRPEAGTAPPAADPEEIRSRVEDARMLFDRGKTDAAIYLLQQIQKADPTNYEVLFKLGEMAIAARNWAYAITVLREASFLRMEDIEVRLVLMDVYRAYQMPVQEIITVREILAIDRKHIAATKRLSELFQEQAMLEDEIEMRQKLKRLVPDDYPNLKRLAVIFDETGRTREAAGVYKQIGKYYPDKTIDMKRLAVLNTRLQQENKKKDAPFRAGISYRDEDADELDVMSVLSEAEYVHMLEGQSMEIGAGAAYDRLQYTGKGTLDGDLDINSVSASIHGTKYWRGGNYGLEAKLGVIGESVSGKLFARNPASGLTQADYPFLKDPSFDSYGGVLPTGGLSFQGSPYLRMSYLLGYDHGLVEDLDARLRMTYFDRAAFSISYEPVDRMELQLQADESAFNDGNLRFHGLASAFYTLGGKQAVRDCRQNQRPAFTSSPLMFLRGGYTYDYFSDQEKAVLYQSYAKDHRHTGELSGQMPIFHINADRAIALNLQYTYAAGTHLDYQRNAGIKLLYINSESKEEIGLSYLYNREKVEEESSNNLIIGGVSDSSTIALSVKWRF